MKAPTFYPSPNVNERPTGVKPSMLVMHYTDMETGEAAFNHLMKPEAQVSAHYLVHESGEIVQMVKDEARAWHAGVSHWLGLDNLNDHSIGIEVVNTGHSLGYTPFPKPQIDAVLTLSKHLVKTHHIKPTHVVAHSDIAPARKKDPGELFPWEKFAHAGVGMWHDVEITSESPIRFKPEDASDAVGSFQKQLHMLGYLQTISGVMDAQTQHNVVAFKRHFIREDLSSNVTLQDVCVLESLLNKYHSDT